MRPLSIFAIVFLAACPKSPPQPLDEAEREEKLQELLEEEEFEDLPESGEHEEG